MKSFSFQEVDGGELTGDNATKLGTAGLDCIWTFVSVIPLDIFKMTPGQFHAIFVVNWPELKQLPTFILAIGLQTQ